jgi:hypothetical protein
MPDIYHSLLGRDLGHLRIVAELWGIELKSAEVNEAAKELIASLLDPERVIELLEFLTPQAREALRVLAASNGRLPYAIFIRQFGDIRDMGAGKRDRERPHLKPATTSESLFYHALIARAFFDTDQGPQEFAYIPDDLFELVSQRISESQGANDKETPLINDALKGEPPGRGATPGEKAHPIPPTDRILDDATTLLAALRLGKLDFAKHAGSAQRNPGNDPKLIPLLHAAGLLKKNIPQAEIVRKFLEAPRGEARKMLIEAWQKSESFNELRLMPGLTCEGEWKNQPQVTREFLLNLLETIPDDKWWNLNALISDIKKKYPDFQRPAGDYDSWFIKRESDGQYLRGFAYWDQVDGALIRFFIMDILYGLGMVELASPESGKDITAFRILNAEALKVKAEDARVKVSSQGTITAPRYAPRAVRYQISRFCEWEDGLKVPGVETKPEEYKYKITPRSLTKAKEQGLKVEHLLTLLAKHSNAGIPPVLIKALKRWEVNGTEARAETQVILKVSRPEVLEELRKSKAVRFLGEPLGPTSIIIKAGAQAKVMAALTEMGLLAEDTSGSGES